MVVGGANVVVSLIFGKKSSKRIFIVFKLSAVGWKVTSNKSVLLMPFELVTTVFFSIVFILLVPDGSNSEKSVSFSNALV